MVTKPIVVFDTYLHSMTQLRHVSEIDQFTLPLTMTEKKLKIDASRYAQADPIPF